MRVSRREATRDRGEVAGGAREAERPVIERGDAGDVAIGLGGAARPGDHDLDVAVPGQPLEPRPQRSGRPAHLREVEHGQRAEPRRKVDGGWGEGGGHVRLRSSGAIARRSPSGGDGA